MVKKGTKNERLIGYLNWPKCLFSIKQGLDRPVTVTATITRPLVLCNMLCTSFVYFVIHYVF